jgi:DNA-directed RNA polymerase subunit RPC12/RpoP
MLECPYCEKEVEPDDEAHEPNVDIEMECPHCEKMFIYQIEYFPSYSAHKAPCLNGGEHDYRRVWGLPAEYYETLRRCYDCGFKIRVVEHA